MRRAPYTPTGLKRLKCVRCDTPATHQIVNEIDGIWYPLCAHCRCFLSELVFMYVRPDYDDHREMIHQYRHALTQE